MCRAIRLFIRNLGLPCFCTIDTVCAVLPGDCSTGGLPHATLFYKHPGGILIRATSFKSAMFPCEIGISIRAVTARHLLFERSSTSLTLPFLAEGLPRMGSVWLTKSLTGHVNDRRGCGCPQLLRRTLPRWKLKPLREPA